MQTTRNQENEVTRTSMRRTLLPGVAALALLLSACGDDADGADGDASGEVAVDGSSTVYPMSNTAAELLEQDRSADRVEVRR